jgi:hypothetical protein
VTERLVPVHSDNVYYMHKRSAPDVFTKNALRCGKDNIFVPRRFHGAASGLRANSPTSPNTLFLSTSATLTSILNSPLPPTALNYHNKRKPHLSSRPNIIIMSRGNQRDTDRAKAQAKLAGNVSLPPSTPHRLQGLSETAY